MPLWEDVYWGKPEENFTRELVVIYYRDVHGASIKDFRYMPIYKLQLSERRGDRDRISLQMEAKIDFFIRLDVP